MARVFIAMPQYRPMARKTELELAEMFGIRNWKPMGMHPMVGGTIHDLKFTNPSDEFLLHVMRFDGVERSQCTLFGQWLYEWNHGNKFDYYLRLDEDIEFHPSAIQSMIDSDKSIIGGAYGYRSDGKLSKKSVCKYLKGEVPDKNGILKIAWLNGGFQFFRSDALLKLVEHYPELYYQRLAEGNGDKATESYALWTNIIYQIPNGIRIFLSEDYSICQRAIEAGMEVYLDTKVELCHWEVRLPNDEIGTPLTSIGYFVGRDPVIVTKENPPWKKRSDETTLSVA